MAHPIEEDQLACAAFDAGYRYISEKSLNEEGERYRGSRFVEGAEWTAKKLYENSASVRLATQGLSKVGQGLNWLGKPLIQASEQNQTAPIYPGATIEGRSGSAILGDVIRGSQWLIDKSGEGAEYWGNKINLDPRISQTIGKGAAEELLTVGTAKALKGASKLKINQSNIPALATVDNVPVSTLNRIEDFTPSNTFAYSSEPLFKGRASRTAGGYMDRGTSGLSSSYIKKKGPFDQLFQKLKAEQVQGPFKHHHILDEAFSGKVLNTTDYKEVLKELNQLKIYPGNSPKNIIGMMDEKNFFLQTAKTDLVQKLNKQGYPGFEGLDNYGHLMRKGNEAQKKLVDDLFKSPDLHKPDTDLIKGKRHPLSGEIIQEPEIRRVEQPFPSQGSIDWKGSYGLDVKSPEFKALSLPEQTALKRQAFGNRFNRLGIDRKSLKYDPSTMMLSKDHINTIHRSVYESPKFTERVNLLKSIEDGSYYKLTPKQKAQKIGEVYKIQHNVSVNTAKIRLKLIKNHIKQTVGTKQGELLLRDPKLLRQWIIDNGAITANLNWKGGVPDYKTLTRNPGRISDELRTVFSTAVKELPNSNNIDEVFSQIRSKGF